MLQNRRPNYINGFSLLELLVVVLVIGVVSAFILPNIVRTLDIYGLDSSAALVRGKLLEARMNAIKRNRTTWLSVELAGGTVTVQSTTGSPATTINVGTMGFISDRVDFATGSSAQVTFDSMGRPTLPQTLTIQAQRTGRQKVVSVSASGRVTVN